MEPTTSNAGNCGLPSSVATSATPRTDCPKTTCLSTTDGRADVAAGDGETPSVGDHDGEGESEGEGEGNSEDAVSAGDEV